MNRTLQQLKETVERLIEQQGADASCAAFIFTKEDVFVVNDDCEQVRFSEEITNKVLNDLDETDYLLEQAFGCIEDYISGYIEEIEDYKNGYIGKIEDYISGRLH
jgi:hypothetical protein